MVPVHLITDNIILWFNWKLLWSKQDRVAKDFSVDQTAYFHSGISLNDLRSNFNTISVTKQQ